MMLEQFFKENKRVAIAFSGGVDSAYLLYAAIQSNIDAKAYFVKSAFQPQFELENAVTLASQMGARMEVLEVDVLCKENITANPADRCYHCKKVIFETIAEAATKDGYPLLIDGTNASDDSADRPGMKALTELSVRSPLRECGLTKDEIRRLSKEAGLFTWDKPAYAFLATRIPTSEAITLEKLRRTETAENFLTSLGFVDFRIRSKDDAAKIQVTARDLPKIIENREAVFEELKRYYKEVTLDLEVRK